ncbi:helix-turn-helix domain-containing protein [Fodinicurvata sediminis]|uniref:helix-turn-helix domain-containing protein n=1 Tax=Fodinicurvata sediminis TaxID=1121832 RepID=UPI0003B69F1B|nr:helix-turn-helix domain-containing protein [Fodinicurvata sediminis]
MVTPTPAIQRAFERAHERWRSSIEGILKKEGALSLEDAAKMLGTNPETVNQMRKKGRLIGLRGLQGDYRYPPRQLDEDGQPFGELPQLIEKLNGHWAAYRFLTQTHPELEGVTGEDALRQGRGEEVLSVADAISEGSFT